MKIDPHLPKLPSVNDLLADPRVKRFVGRIHQSTVAQRATGFLEELRSSLAEKATQVGLTDAGQWPTVGQLAERFARRLLGSAPEGVAAINATGVVIGTAGVAAPLPEGAVHAMLQQAGEYLHRDAQELLLQRELAHLAQGSDSLVCTNYEAAVALLATAGNGTVAVVARDAARTSTDHGVAFPLDWQAAGRASGAALRFVEWNEALSDAEAIDAGLWIVVSSICDDASSEERLAQLTQLSRQAHDRGARVIDAAGWAGAIDPGQFGYASTPTIAQRLEAGVDAVVVRGDGLLGGPAVGLAVGDPTLLAAARRHVLARLSQPDSIAVAALTASLAASRQGFATSPQSSDALQQVPAWQLLTAPIDNLRNRAERLASILSQLPDVESAESVEVISPWLQWGREVSSGPSWAVAIRPRDASADDVAERLRRLPTSVDARCDQGRVLLDLRSVFVRWDHQLETLWQSPVSEKPASSVRDAATSETVIYEEQPPCGDASSGPESTGTD
ncbi:MAG: hypothetical protein KDA61_17235 [Planctomycetales bacterium]|nr:hypothetical protein [Planctomycetales bacterium]